MANYFSVKRYRTYAFAHSWGATDCLSRIMRDRIIDTPGRINGKSFENGQGNFLTSRSRTGQGVPRDVEEVNTLRNPVLLRYDMQLAIYHIPDPAFLSNTLLRPIENRFLFL